ncbi:MAG: hypothetical protein ACRD3E_16580 [Terriglobales bacterium]
MNGEPNQPRQDADSPALRQQMELFTFLREEAQANREALRTEADATRKLFTVISGIVAIPLAIAIAIAGWLWSHDLNTMKEAMKQEGEAAAKIEIKKMDEQIDETLQSQFQKDTIQSTIKSAAIDATRNEAKPLIEAGVKSQIKDAVAQQSGMIQKIATSAVNDKVQKTIGPLASKVEESVAAISIHALVARANADDAMAYDELLRIKDAQPPNQRALINGVISDRARYELNNTSGILRVNGETLSFSSISCRDPKSAIVQHSLRSSDVLTRKGVLQSCATWADDDVNSRILPDQSTSALQIEEELIPEVMKVALEDQSLSVRGAAFSIINGLFKHSPGFPEHAIEQLDTVALKSWWRTNEVNFQALHLLSRVSSSKKNLDLSELYERISRLKSMSPPDLKPFEEDALVQMRENAVRFQDDREALVKKMGRNSCASVASDFDLRLQDWERRPGVVDFDEYGTWELEFLETCPVEMSQVPRLVRLATDSNQLSRRYAASMLLKTWVAAKFDPFDRQAIQEWWNQHKGQYSK